MDSKHVFHLCCVCKERASRTRLEAKPWTSILLLTEPLMLSKHNLGYLQLKLLLCGMSILGGSASLSLWAQGEFLGLIRRKVIWEEKLLELFSISSLLAEEALREPCFC